MRTSIVSNNVAVLFLLDLSAAFETTDHSILIACLEKWDGLSGTVLEWAFLSEKTFFVSLAVSQTFDFDYGVPQGSILCPILFSLHTLPLENTINYHNVKYHCYADDIQFHDDFTKRSLFFKHYFLPVYLIIISGLVNI